MRGISNKAYEWCKQDEAVTVTPSQAIWTAISQRKRTHLAQNMFSCVICIRKKKTLNDGCNNELKIWILKYHKKISIY